MTNGPIDTPARERALALLERFVERILPGILHRIAAWKHIAPAALPELRDDVAQELTIDCLLDPAAVLAAPRIERHARWIRLAERWVYQHHVRSRRHIAADPDLVLAADPAPDPSGSEPQLAQLVDPLPFVWLKNGRCNLQASARAMGTSTGAVREQLDRLATRLGDDGKTARFWERRLAEALLGYGADVLRLHLRLTTLVPRADWPQPDPSRRLMRVRRLTRRFALLRTAQAVREVLAAWRNHVEPTLPAGRRALRHSTSLWPEHAAAWLWSFEAELGCGDLPAAARTIRTSRRLTGRRSSAFVLARARLLEARGQAARGLRMIDRAAAANPGDPRLRRVRRLLAATTCRGVTARTPAPQGSSTRRSCSASSRSAAGSPRTLPQYGNPSGGSTSERASTTTARSSPSRNTDARRWPVGEATGSQSVASRKSTGSSSTKPP
ncbi:MAG: hypothetical protein NXI31_25750 [bacterium]|nr:hypothetical protein [bacterium]